MRATTLKLGKDTVAYGFGSVVGKSLNVFLLPVLTRLFSVEAYGTIDLITLVITFFNAVGVLGLDSAIGVYYFEQKTEKDKQFYFSSYFWGVAALSLAFAAVGMLSAPLIARSVLKNTALSQVFRVACLTIPATIIFQATLTFTRFQFRPKSYNLLVTANLILNVVLAIVLVKFLGLRIAGVYWAKAISAGFVVLVAMEYKNIGFHFQLAKLRKLVLYGLPIVPLALITYASNSMGRYFLKYFWGDTEIGIYAFAFRLSGVAGIVFTAFNLAFQPFASKLRFEPDFHQAIDQIVRVFLFGAGCLLLSVYCFSKPMVYLFGTKDYLVSERFLTLGMLLLFLNICYQVFNIGVCYAKKTVYITYSQLVALLLSFFLNLLLVPGYKVFGAFVASTVSLIAANLTIFAIAQHKYPIRYNVPKLIEQFLLISFMAFISFWITTLGLKIAVLAAYILMSVVVRSYVKLPPPAELKLAIERTQARWNPFRS